ncbi:hypothetical protein CspeluHIS016_0103250 [Cutaneotrichosporon spelunceum]|uniref:Ribosomal RNA-processing protein 7 C-terminal domain-containing protein n=1 Tax=Cutaneotrichosporon spelunceum TaxID=1672016 RepID=A0AAD3Y9J5_9TREE|nr:hypothetical protein CspeluHIS016_0103250 [Cutaneotrichosporon spelunceum]
MPRPSLGTPKTKSKGTPKATPKSSKSKSAKLYSNFRPLPLALPTNATHYIYVRPHTTKSGDDAELERTARTLFAANIPVDAGERDLRALFSRWGVVEAVEEGSASVDVLGDAVAGLPESDDEDEEGEAEEEEEKQGADADGWTFVGTAQQARKRRRKAALPASVPDVVPLDTVRSLGLSGARSARVVFTDAVSVSRAMGYGGAPIALPLGEGRGAEPTGLAFYEARYAALRPALASVRAHADSAMERYDHLHSLLLASRAKAHGAGALVDEDGFTVVVRGGRYGRTAGRGGSAGVAVASRAGVAAAQKKRGKGAGELKDFYKFQSVDRKRKELADMRARFDEDRRKVDELKRQRRFKPY